MTSTPSVRTTTPAKQAPKAPDRMDLVTEWETRSRDKIEVYADRAEHDGYVIAIGPYGAETAAYLTDIDLDSPTVEWCGRFSKLSDLWRSDQTLIVRAVLAAWEAAV
ncbi:hypothetical protein GCM10029992_01910 [Glycomyces albus]